MRAISAGAKASAQAREEEDESPLTSTRKHRGQRSLETAWGPLTRKSLERKTSLSSMQRRKDALTAIERKGEGAPQPYEPLTTAAKCGNSSEGKKKGGSRKSCLGKTVSGQTNGRGSILCLFESFGSRERNTGQSQSHLQRVIEAGNVPQKQGMPLEEE